MCGGGTARRRNQRQAFRRDQQLNGREGVARMYRPRHVRGARSRSTCAPSWSLIARGIERADAASALRSPARR